MAHRTLVFMVLSFLALTDNGAVNILICVFWLIYASIFLQCKPRRGLVGS